MVVSLAVVAVFLIVGYRVVADTNSADDTDTYREGLTASVIALESFIENRDGRAEKFDKYDLLGNITSSDEYGIVDEPLVIDAEALLSTEKWGNIDFGNNGLSMRFPLDGWYIQKNDEQNTSVFVLTTTKTGKAEGGPFAKITIGEYQRSFDQTLFDWMQDPYITEEEDVPPQDKTLQYVTIGESVFLGSFFFNEPLTTGIKNVYAEVTTTDIFAATLEVQNVMKGSKQEGVYDNIFYSILESLEVK